MRIASAFATGLVTLALLALNPGALSAAGHFIIVQPGYPGSTAEAEQFVSDLLGAIGKGGGPGDLQGEYHNDAQEALKAINEKHPQLGIVSLGFYLAHKDDLHLEPLLSSRPLDRFYLASKKGSAIQPKDLSGKAVAGTPFQEQEFVARILFGLGAGGGPVAGGTSSSEEGGKEREAAKGAAGAAKGGGADVSQWKVEATRSSTKGIRDASRGKVAAVLLTEREKRALDSLTAGQELEVYYRTEELPTAIMVSLGKKDAPAEGAAKALAGLKDNPEGQSLLALMGIEGFVPVGEQELAKFEARYRADGGPNRKVEESAKK